MTKIPTDNECIKKSYIGVHRGRTQSTREGLPPTSEQITLQEKAAHKKPMCYWKSHSYTESGSGHFLKFQLDVKFFA
jgi:hypothetical protein